MYAKYKYKAGTTYANLLSDVVAIICGETNKVNLSADCDQDLTSINTAFKPSGWTLHDAAPGIANYNTQIVKAPHADDPTQFKYAEIGVKTDYASGNRFFVGGMEDWDNVGKVSVNRFTQVYPYQYGMTLDLTDGGSIYIYATERLFMLYGKTDTESGIVHGNMPVGIFEFTRLDIENTAGNMPSFAAGPIEFKFYQSTCCPQCPASGDNSNIYGGLGTISSFVNGDNANNQIPKLLPNRNVGGETSYVMHPIMFANMYTTTDSRRFFGGSVTELEDVHLTRLSSIIGDQIVVNGTDVYVAFPTVGYNGTSILCRIS